MFKCQTPKVNWTFLKGAKFGEVNFRDYGIKLTSSNGRILIYAKVAKIATNLLQVSPTGYFSSSQSVEIFEKLVKSDTFVLSSVVYFLV